MTIEDQVVALFAKANPVPSLDLLDPIEPLDIDYLTDRSERSRDMSEVKTIEPREEARRTRWAPVLVAALVAVAAVAVLLSRGVFDTQPATPIEVVDAYYEAVNERDFETVAGLFPPGTERSFIEEQVNLEDWELGAALGWHYVPQDCQEVSQGDGGVQVECAYTATTDLTRVLGLEPQTGQVTLLIEDGHIQGLTETTVSEGDTFEVLQTFHDWVAENHPDDVDTMISSSLMVQDTPESMALWEQYVDEFVAEMEAAG
jgi:hypothetical protein